MKLVIKFPTRNRPSQFLKTLDRYLRFLDDKNTTIIVTCDNDDLSMKEDHITEYLKQYQNVKVFFGDNNGKIDAINANLEGVDFDIILLASDDMLPVVKGFDTIIKNKMTEHYQDTDGVLWFNDGHTANKLNTLSILGKKYYDRFGYIYNPEYKSVYCDNEFTDVANILKRQTYFDEVIIEHQHPDWGYGNRDEIHSMNQINVGHDNAIYNKRKLINFGL